MVSPEIVDLGLPSGTLWASAHLGAKVPEEVGNYYAWGEPKAKAQFTLENHIHYDKVKKELKNVTADIAGTSSDPAFVALGGYWRMPTLEQMRELINNCKRTYEEINGVRCTRFTGPNDNSIIIPNNNVVFYSEEEEAQDGLYILWSDHPYSQIRAQGFPIRPVNVDPELVAESKRKTEERLEAIRQKNIAIELEQNVVDLGLGVYWSNRNYGANRPSDVGVYIGEPYQIIENKLPFSGLHHRLPTEQELKDLVEKCSWTATTEEGTNGYKVTGPNGNSIFIPCGGKKGPFEFDGLCYLVCDKKGFNGQRILKVKAGKPKFTWGIFGYNVRPVYVK